MLDPCHPKPLSHPLVAVALSRRAAKALTSQRDKTQSQSKSGSGGLSTAHPLCEVHSMQKRTESTAAPRPSFHPRVVLHAVVCVLVM